MAFLDTVDEPNSKLSAPLIVRDDESNPYVLSDIEKAKVVEAWDSGATKLKDIVAKACGSQFDLRSSKADAVRDFLTSRGASPALPVAPKVVILTEDQKATIASMATTTKPLEIARLIFKNQKLTHASLECRVVRECYDSLDIPDKLSQDESLTSYHPPANESQAINRVNRYVLDAIDVGKPTQRQREGIQKLIRFMRTQRFLQEVGLLKSQGERLLFESSFVRFCHDKPDLTEEEIDLYINVCVDIISYKRMQSELNQLTEARDTAIEDDQKIPMAIVDSIGKLRSDMDDCIKRQQSTLKDLNGKRGDRLKEIHNNNSSILSLIHAFQEKDKRDKILLLIEARKDAVLNEVDRLSTMDGLCVEVLGIHRDEIFL